VSLIAGANASFAGISPVDVSISGLQSGSISLPEGINTSNAAGLVGRFLDASGTGTINLPASSSINTSGGNGLAGGLSAIAGGSGNAINLGDIVCSSSTNNGGFITIQSGQPQILGGSPSGVIHYVLGQPAANSGFYNSGIGLSGSISTGNISSTGDSVYMSTSGSVTSGNINTSGAGGSALVSGAPGGSGGNINISAGGNITTGSLESYGGGGSGGNGTSQPGGVGGLGGAVSLNSAAGSIIAMETSILLVVAEAAVAISASEEPAVRPEPSILL